MLNYDCELAAKRVGSALGTKYRLDALIGVGGMAAVYRASHRNGHRVAVKVLNPWLAVSAEVRARFLKESYIANAVEHRNVVRVLDDDVTEDGTTYLVMDLLDGESLADMRERVPGGTLPLRDVVRMASEVLDVLATAHARGIIHRDIKPGNVFLTRDGQVKVLDFGIARMRDVAKTYTPTRTGGTLGTPAFMPPEQALGLMKDVDGRTDLWALGATMFTLLSGRLVHEAETVEAMLVYTATRPVPSLAEIVSDVPAPIVEVIDRALSFERSDRYPDAGAMREALAAACEGLFGDGSKSDAPAFGSSLPPPPLATIVTPSPSVLLTTAGVVHTRPPAARSAWKWVAGAALGLATVWAIVGTIAFSEYADHRAAQARRTAIVTAPPPSPAPPPAESAAPPPPAEAAPDAKPAAEAPKPKRAKGRAAEACNPPWTIDPITHGRKVKPGC